MPTNGQTRFGRQSMQSDVMWSLIAQALTLRSGGQPYPTAPPFSAHVARWMMQDPVVALGFAITLYPILVATWSVDAVEDAKDELVNYAQAQYVKHRTFLLKQLSYSLQFGARVLAREIALENGFQVSKWKPLRPEGTELMSDQDTGEFLGVRQGQKEAPAEMVMRHTNDLEDDNYLGRSRFINLKDEAWWPSRCLAANIQKIENNKLVGVMPIWYFDTTPRKDAAGVKVDPRAEAEDGLLKLQDAVGLAIPNLVTENMTLAEIAEASKQGRNKIDVIQFPDSAAAMSALMQRARDYDSQKMRGMLKPERMALEGTYGSYSSTAAFGDIGLLDSDHLHKDWTCTIDLQGLQPDLERNFAGYKRGDVYLKAGPLQNDDKEFYRTLVTTLMSNPAAADLMIMAIDKDSVLDRADIPKSDETIDFDKLQAELEQKRQQTQDVSQEQKDQLDKFAAALSAPEQRYLFGGYNHGCNQYKCDPGGGGDVKLAKGPKEQATAIVEEHNSALKEYKTAFKEEGVRMWHDDHAHPIPVKNIDGIANTLKNPKMLGIYSVPKPLVILDSFRQSLGKDFNKVQARLQKKVDAIHEKYQIRLNARLGKKYESNRANFQSLAERLGLPTKKSLSFGGYNHGCNQYRCTAGGGGKYMAVAKERLASLKLAREKIKNAPVPTKEAVAKARAELEKARLGLGRAGGESRGGGSKDRAKQRENLFKEFGGDKRGYVVCPWTGTKMHWQRDNPKGYPVFERGKIFTKAQGGGYQLKNLIPESFEANRSRNDAVLRRENAVA